MRFEQLEALEAVTRHGSIRRASEELNLSQPALSETVRNLERELGVVLFDRLRSGARINTAGQELMPYVTEVIESVNRLRGAADEQVRVNRTIRMGTVSAATVAIVLPAIHQFVADHPDTHIEVVNARQVEIHRSLLDGRLELGLVNLLDGDDVEPDLESTELIRGRAVVCFRHDNHLADLETIPIDRLRTEPLIAMRPGYVMHRYVHRLLRGDAVGIPFATDGAEMGKVMVTEGLGVTVLPDFSLIGDPLVLNGTIVYRRLDTTDDGVTLVLQRRRTRHVPDAIRSLEKALERQASIVRETWGQMSTPEASTAPPTR